MAEIRVVEDVYDPPEVREALRQVDVAELCAELGVETYGRRGDMLDGHCPFHDGGGGWGIYVDGESKGWSHCFVCEGNGILRLIAVAKGLSKTEAEAWFYGRYEVDRRLYPSAEDVGKLLAKASEAAAEPPPETDYLPPAGTVRRHPDLLRHIVEVRGYPVADAVAVADMAGASYCVSGYYREGIITPVVLDGRTRSFVAEARDRQSVLPGPKGNKRRVFPEGAKTHQLVYGLDEAVAIARRRGLRWVVFVEGHWDARRLLWWGIPAVAIFGAILHPAQAALLIARFPTIYSCLDADIRKPPTERRRGEWEARAAAVIGDASRFLRIHLPEERQCYFDGKGDPGGLTAPEHFWRAHASAA